MLEFRKMMGLPRELIIFVDNLFADTWTQSVTTKGVENMCNSVIYFKRFSN